MIDTNDSGAPHVQANSRNLESLVRDLQHVKQQSTNAILKKGLLAGLFSLDYMIGDSVRQLALTATSDPSSIADETAWQAEYALCKSKWKQDIIMRHSSLVGMSAGEAVSGISSVASHAAPSGVNSMPVPSSTAHQSRVALRWTLDIDQQTAFCIVAQHADNHEAEQLKMFLSGHVGSGKSQVIKALCDFFEERNESHRLRLAAFMGIAAHNINGVTLHAALNLSPRTNSPSKLAKATHELRQMWCGVDYLFIDEISMISCEFLLRVSDALIVATGHSLPFGGIHVICSGDMGQLAPVAETPLSRAFNENQNALFTASQRRMRGWALWLSIDTIIILQGNNRQSGDHNARFRELLGRLRQGICNDGDYLLLSSRVISKAMPREHLAGFSTASVIVCDNEAKDALNDRFARRFAESTSQELHWYASEDYIENTVVTPTSAHAKIIASLHSGATQYRLQRLPLVPGMCMMVTHNLSLECGVVNGVVGTLVGIRYKLGMSGERVLMSCTIFIQSNAHKPPMPGLAPGLYPVMPDTCYFTFSHPRLPKPLSVKRIQCPLVPAFAMTAHKSQGQSLQSVIIDLESCRGTEAPYVMVSRATSLDGLLVYRPFDQAKIRRNMSQDCRAEERHLDGLYSQTLQKYQLVEHWTAKTASPLSNAPFPPQDITHPQLSNLPHCLVPREPMPI